MVVRYFVKQDPVLIIFPLSENSTGNVARGRIAASTHIGPPYSPGGANACIGPGRIYACDAV